MKHLDALSLGTRHGNEVEYHSYNKIDIYENSANASWTRNRNEMQNLPLLRLVICFSAPIHLLSMGK